MLSDDSDFEEIQTLTINEHYAKAFEYRKEREELAKRTFLRYSFTQLQLTRACSKGEIRIGC